jgi:hypothetical protein
MIPYTTRRAMGQTVKSENVYRCIQIICLKNSVCLPVLSHGALRASSIYNSSQFYSWTKKNFSPFLPVPTVVLTGHCIEVCPILQGWQAGSFCNVWTRRHPLLPAKSHETDALMPKDVGRATDLIRAEVRYGVGKSRNRVGIALPTVRELYVRDELTFFPTPRF